MKFMIMIMMMMVRGQYGLLYQFLLTDISVMSILSGFGSVQSEVSVASSSTNQAHSISVSDRTEVASSCSSSNDDDDECEEEEICCFRMKKVDDHPWCSDIDAINFQVNRDISMSSALIYRPFDEEIEEEDSYKFQIYHTKSGKMILEQNINCLEDTDQPQVGILKFENPLKIDSNRIYTAVLETRRKKSIGGSEGLSVVCSRVDRICKSLVVIFTQPTKDDLGER